MWQTYNFRNQKFANTPSRIVIIQINNTEILERAFNTVKRKLKEIDIVKWRQIFVIQISIKSR